MEDLTKSLIEWFKEKTNSPIYTIFIFAFLSWNWKTFYILFFEENIPINISHIEYAQQFSRIYYQIPYLGSWIDIISHPLNWILIIIFLFSVPIIITYLFIWYLPEITSLAHKTYLAYEFKRKIEFHEQNTQFQENIAVEKENEVKAVERQVVAKEKITKQLTQEEKWQIEYNEFKKNRLFSSFNIILNCVYKNEGHTTKWTGGGTIRVVGADILAIADSLNIISITKKDKEIIQLTDKGKYFSKKYLEEHLL